MSQENFGWLFVDAVPLLYESKRVARQLQIEVWLDLTQMAKELQLGLNEMKKDADRRAYIV